MKKLIKGEKVKIYEDPYTELKLEGKAMLYEKLLENADMEYWNVVIGRKLFPRWIKKEEI